MGAIAGPGSWAGSLGLEFTPAIDAHPDAVVVGAGPGGLAAAHVLARTLRRDGPDLPRVAVVEKGSPIGVARGSGIGLAVNRQRTLRGIDPGERWWGPPPCTQHSSVDALTRSTNRARSAFPVHAAMHAQACRC
jgi:2-polyprenyl-6-methoxyphenol hydroxylase-like FAD-dependent oxidoreductase